MADNRKYYYLKLKEDFFDTDEMKILESMKDGYLYSNILLKLYLKSLSNSGRLMYRNVIPYTPEILATLTGHQVGTVEKALDVFKKLDLIEMLDNGAIYMMDIQNFIGQSSSEADRQREYYNRMKAEKEALAGESTETPELPEPKEPVPPAEQKSNKAIGNYTTDFEELWEAYPRKVDKGQAYKKYKARLEDGFSHEQLYEAVKNYAAQCKNPDEEERIMAGLNAAKLLIIDDLGAERSTDYALEKVYNIIDSRYLSGKPLILTTNMTLKDMQESEDIRYRRIYDRIFEMCFPVRFAGRSWREKAASKRFDAMKNLMEE